MSDSLQPHGLQHTRLPCPSPSPAACSNLCPLSWCCHPTFGLSQKQGMVFSNEAALHIRWPKYWSFSISPSNEYSGLISFRIDWLILQSKGLSRVFFSTTVQKHQSFGTQGFPGGSAGKESACNVGDLPAVVQSLGLEDPLKKGRATHSSILAWRIPWTI